jgi:pyruvate/2-oxoglutarate dehydrogenase complex dihydrolipoamide acyltransferase (E2) component
MPFLYELKLAPMTDPAEPSYTFVQQLVPAGTLVGANQPLATLTDGTMEYHLPAPEQGLLAAWLVQHGDTLENGDTLARIVAEGDPHPVPAATPYRLG